jgi:hypothetical protein
MLHKIYAQAHVVSWLGGSLDLNLNLVRVYISFFARLWIEAVREGRQFSIDLTRLFAEQLESHVDKQDITQSHEYTIRTLRDILTGEYFHRVWIAQELILGKTNTCMIGDTLHSVAVLAAAMQTLDRWFGNHGEVERTIYWYFEPALHNKWPSEPLLESSQDLEIVITANEGNCSDERDYIYGVTSLFKNPDNFTVDYKLSKAEVFANFAIHCMSNDRNISVLNQGRPAIMDRDTAIDTRPDLPTWCPDWSFCGGKDDVRFNEIDRTDRPWQASGNTEVVYYRPSKVTLALRGLLVCRLKLCSDSTLDMRIFDGDSSVLSLIWLGQNESLCAFLRLQGVQIGLGIRNDILRMFERILHPPDFYVTTRVVVSQEMRLLLDQTDNKDLMSLVALVYLAEADPELFDAAGFTIDERIPPDDYAKIRTDMSHTFWDHSERTRLFFTDDGMMGTGFPSVREGDLVCIIYGSIVPQILRQADKGGEYILVGSCNVDGLMYGEGLEMGLAEQDFILV